MTFGEMKAWTNRLKNIMEVGGELRQKRLWNLENDLRLATNYKKDKCAADLISTVADIRLSGLRF